MEINLTNEEREKFIRLCQAARAAILEGNLYDAHLFYRHAAYIHPFSTTVWIGLAKVVDNDEDRRVALENVLAINPNHAEAQQMLQKLK